MKKRQKKFQKYFSYQPNKETNPNRVKMPFTLVATTPRTHLSEKNLHSLIKRGKISFPLANLIFLFKKNWRSLGRKSKSSFSALLHNSKNTEKPENANILATGVKKELCNKSSFSLVSLVFRYGARRLGPARTRGNRKKSER